MNNRKLLYFNFLLILFLALSCKKANKLDITDYLGNETFTNSLKVEGQEFKGLIIENCTFDGGELYLSDVDSVIIKNCTFKNQKQNGIKIGFNGVARWITIENCTFENIGYNGIDSHENAPNCTIKNCYFKNCALSDIGPAMGQAHHAIYWKGKEVKILGNEFYTDKQNYGNAISHRSSGLISGNKIYNAKKYGIMYFSDHPGSDSLFIENNFLINCKNGIGLTTSGELDNHNKNIHIRFNSLYNSKSNSVFIAPEYEVTTDIKIYGNIIVQESEKYIQSEYEIDSFSNLKSDTDIGFVNANDGDLHINSNSIANNFCIGLTTYPFYDIDGELRSITNQDAGADETN